MCGKCYFVAVTQATILASASLPDLSVIYLPLFVDVVWTHISFEFCMAEWLKAIDGVSSLCLSETIKC